MGHDVFGSRALDGNEGLVVHVLKSHPFVPELLFVYAHGAFEVEFLVAGIEHHVQVRVVVREDHIVLDSGVFVQNQGKLAFAVL